MNRLVRGSIAATSLALVIGSVGHGVSAKTVLTIAPWGGMGDKNKGGVMEQLIAEYQKLRPDVEFDVISLPMNSYDGLPKLLLMPEVPDLVETHLSLLPELMKANLPSPMPTDMEARARRFFFKPVLEPLEIQGRLYGLPTEYILYALGYNNRLFEEEGVAGPPQTWEELRLLASKSTRRDPTGRVTRVGFGFPGGWAGHGEAATHAFLALLWSNNGTYIDNQGRARLSDPPAQQTVEFLTNMMRDQSASLVGWDGIPNGTTFMAITPSWARGGFSSAMGADFVNASTSLIPRGAGPYATTQYGWGFFVPTKAKNAKEAWEFLNWLTMQEGPGGLTRTGLAMANLGSVPTNPIDLQARRDLHTANFWRGFVAGMNVARPEPSYPQIMNRWKELGKALEPVLQLRISPVQGVADAQRTITRVLELGDNYKPDA